MTRTELLKAVLAVNKACDRIVGSVDAPFEGGMTLELRERLLDVLHAGPGEGIFQAAERTCRAAQEAFDQLQMYKEHAVTIGRIVDTQPGADAVVAVRALQALVEKSTTAEDRNAAEARVYLGARHGERLVDAAKRVLAEKDEQIQSSQRRIVELEVALHEPPSSGDMVAMEAFDSDVIIGTSKALCRRDGETLLQAAERNRDRIIELTRQIDAQDAKLCRLLSVGPEGVVKEIARMLSYVKQLEHEVENLKDAAKEEGE